VVFVVLNGNHWTYAVKPTFVRGIHIANPINYSNSFVTYHRVAEVEEAATICMEVNDAANTAEANMTEEQRIELRIRANQFDASNPIHVAVFNRMTEKGFQLPSATSVKRKLNFDGDSKKKKR